MERWQLLQVHGYVHQFQWAFHGVEHPGGSQFNLTQIVPARSDSPREPSRPTGSQSDHSMTFRAFTLVLDCEQRTPETSACTCHSASEDMETDKTTDSDVKGRRQRRTGRETPR
jgi:hypothetical protein